MAQSAAKLAPRLIPIQQFQYDDSKTIAICSDSFLTASVTIHPCDQPMINQSRSNIRGSLVIKYTENEQET